MQFTIRGIHPVDEQHCHLVEVELDGDGSLNWGEVTQAAPGQPPRNWQVAYDEQPLDRDRHRWAFFIHYLDLNAPLLTPFGPVRLPAPTPRPPHLAHVMYIEPD